MEGGSPAAIDLTVSFSETTQLARQKYMAQVSALTGANRDWAKAEKGTQIVDQEIHRDEGVTVNMTDAELAAYQEKQAGG